MSRVLVTGHRGYVGSVLAPFLRDAGHDVRGLDVDFYADSAWGPERDDGVPTIRKDLRDVQPEDLRGFDAVVHLAALSNDPLGELDPARTLEINHEASVRLAVAARKAGVGRFLFASSCSMYGASGDAPVTEEAPLNPLTDYARSKVQTEADLVRLADASFSPVSLRNATAYGASPRMRFDLVLNNLVGWAVTTGKIRILSDGMPWRPLVHIEDMARAFQAALEAPREAVHAQAFNVGDAAENYRVRDIAEIVRKTVPGCTVEITGASGSDRRSYRVDFSKIRQHLPAFRPAWTVPAGAREIYDACRRNGLDRAAFEGHRFTRLHTLRRLISDGRIDQRLRWKETSTEPRPAPTEATTQ